MSFGPSTDGGCVEEGREDRGFIFSLLWRLDTVLLSNLWKR